jgi:AcrR family transcriptional regulator
MTSPIRKSTADRRRDIERAALDLAHEHGPGNVSTGMIAARLRLTQPAIYKHFPRKEDIWHAVAESLAEKISANVSAAPQAHGDPVDCLRHLVLEHLRLVEKNPALPEVMTMRGSGREHGAFQGTIQTAMAGFRLALEREVARAMKTSVFRRDMDMADAAQLILGLIQSLVLRMLVSRNTGVFRDDAERLLELLLNGFMAKGECQ